MNGRGTSLGRHEEPRKREVAIEETVKRGERRGSEDGKQGEGKGNKVDALGVCRQVLVTGGHVVKSVWINKLKQSLKKKNITFPPVPFPKKGRKKSCNWGQLLSYRTESNSVSQLHIMHKYQW